jgi:hypothetical protein
MQPKGIRKTPTCKTCGEKGHRKDNKIFHPVNKLSVDKPVVIEIVKEPISVEEYQTTIDNITSVLPDAIKLIIKDADKKDEDALLETRVANQKDDGRVNSSLLEKPLLDCLKDLLLKKDPSMCVEIQQIREAADIKINGVWINLKLTSGKTDNACSKSGIYFSYTSDTNFPIGAGVNWNEFKICMDKAKSEGKIKKTRQKSTEYHYLAVNKVSGDFILKSIFDIHTYKSNPSNDLQINWKNEFVHRDYVCDDYCKKQSELYKALQLSQKKSIETRNKFTDEDFEFV